MDADNSRPSASRIGPQPRRGKPWCVAAAQEAAIGDVVVSTLTTVSRPCSCRDNNVKESYGVILHDHLLRCFMKVGSHGSIARSILRMLNWGWRRCRTCFHSSEGKGFPMQPIIELGKAWFSVFLIPNCFSHALILGKRNIQLTWWNICACWVGVQCDTYNTTT